MKPSSTPRANRSTSVAASSNTMGRRDKDPLRESSEELTTATSTLSDEEFASSGNNNNNNGVGWFGDIRSLAQSTKNTFLPGIQAIGSAIHSSAMAVAAEIAQLEQDAEQEAERWREQHYYDESAASQSSTSFRVLNLPWEVEQPIPMGATTATVDEGAEPSTKYVKDEVLRAKILELSLYETTFLEPFTTSKVLASSMEKENGLMDEYDISMDDFVLNHPRIRLIRRMLQVDDNLARVHARLSGRTDEEETVFWKNFFYHCEVVRKAHFDSNDNSNNDGADDEVRSRSTQGSLIPVPDNSVAGDTGGDDTSYVCVNSASIASAPSSLNTLGTMSIGDMILVGSTTSPENPDVDSGDEL